ncbi:MAG: hypothetical protein K8T90_20215 [Planctomycetes bacterium]|nr:hypothetical protein [Planctomycetota bacterium]
MRLIHTVAVVVGLAAAVWGVRMLVADPVPLPSSGGLPDGAPTGSVREVLLDADGAPMPTPQVTMLDGPGVNDKAPNPDDAPQAEGSTLRTIRNESRRAQVEEVLKNLDGAAVWVEGVDGVVPTPPARRQR